MKKNCCDFALTLEGFLLTWKDHVFKLPYSEAILSVTNIFWTRKDPKGPVCHTWHHLIVVKHMDISDSKQASAALTQHTHNKKNICFLFFCFF